MPNNLVLCPSCEADVPDGVYCNSCGKPLQIEDTSDKVEPEVEESGSSELAGEYPDSPSSPITEPEEMMLPIFSFSIDKMDDRSAAILFSGSELEVLNAELDVLIEKIRATRHALELDHADKDLLEGHCRPHPTRRGATRRRGRGCSESSFRRSRRRPRS